MKSIVSILHFIAVVLVLAAAANAAPVYVWHIDTATEQVAKDYTYDDGATDDHAIPAGGRVRVEVTAGEYAAGWDALDAAGKAAKIAEGQTNRDDQGAPNTGWSNLTRRERFLVRCLWRLAKEHWPALTLEQFRTQLRAEWDATPESE